MSVGVGTSPIQRAACWRLPQCAGMPSRRSCWMLSEAPLSGDAVRYAAGGTLVGTHRRWNGIGRHRAVRWHGPGNRRRCPWQCPDRIGLRTNRSRRRGHRPGVGFAIHASIHEGGRGVRPVRRESLPGGVGGRSGIHGSMQLPRPVGLHVPNRLKVLVRVVGCIDLLNLDRRPYPDQGAALTNQGHDHCSDGDRRAAPPVVSGEPRSKHGCAYVTDLLSAYRSATTGTGLTVVA